MVPRENSGAQLLCSEFMLKPTIFREYDIRGVAETELQSPDIVDLGRGIGTLLQREAGKRINLGRDCRLSSPRLHERCSKGCSRQGCEVADIRRGANAAALLFRRTSEGRRRGDDHRQPQSERV